MNSKIEKIPDTADAEQWLDEDTFIAWGKVWHITPCGEIIYLKEVP